MDNLENKNTVKVNAIVEVKIPGQTGHESVIKMSVDQAVILKKELDKILTAPLLKEI